MTCNATSTRESNPSVVVDGNSRISSTSGVSGTSTKCGNESSKSLSSLLLFRSPPSSSSSRRLFFPAEDPGWPVRPILARSLSSWSSVAPTGRFIQVNCLGILCHQGACWGWVGGLRPMERDRRVVTSCRILVIWRDTSSHFFSRSVVFSSYPTSVQIPI
jgi:hypothetical protein